MPVPEVAGRLTEPELEEIERMARENVGEPYRGPLLALVGEVRRLRARLLTGKFVVPGMAPGIVETRSASGQQPSTLARKRRRRA